ncbi:hypothetical protein L539_4070 [Bordetella hinzii 5132]|nr:hypothetical protein L539_4070 [Bordetella hinzii 5132]
MCEAWKINKNSELALFYRAGPGAFFGRLARCSIGIWLI